MSTHNPGVSPEPRYYVVRMNWYLYLQVREGTAVICLKHQAQTCQILVPGKPVQWDLCASILYESDTKHLININKAETSTYAGETLLRSFHNN